MIYEQYNIPDDNKTYFFTDTRGYIFVLVVYLSSARGHTITYKVLQYAAYL